MGVVIRVLKETKPLRKLHLIFLPFPPLFQLSVGLSTLLPQISIPGNMNGDRLKGIIDRMKMKRFANKDDDVEIVFFTASFFTFCLSQAAYFALSYTICQGTGAKVDGSFLGTLLETTAVTFLFLAWRSITESSWEGTVY
jgi:hypothetical protein